MTDDQKRKAIVDFVLNLSEDVQGAMAQHLGLHIEVIKEEVIFYWISEVKN
jgi:hypothetical protein